jgi:chromosome segregation ATPase
MVTSLKSEIKQLTTLITEERKKTSAAETTAQGCRSQLSQLAKERNELDQRVKTLEGMESKNRRLEDTCLKYQISNADLRVRRSTLPKDNQADDFEETIGSSSCPRAD